MVDLRNVIAIQRVMIALPSCSCTCMCDNQPRRPKQHTHLHTVPATLQAALCMVHSVETVASLMYIHVYSMLLIGKANRVRTILLKLHAGALSHQHQQHHQRRHMTEKQHDETMILVYRFSPDGEKGCCMCIATAAWPDFDNVRV